jgi:hypothetical protein
MTYEDIKERVNDMQEREEGSKIKIQCMTWITEESTNPHSKHSLRQPEKLYTKFYKVPPATRWEEKS